jgi:hypothetical protein
MNNTKSYMGYVIFVHMHYDTQSVFVLQSFSKIGCKESDTSLEMWTVIEVYGIF